MNTQEGAEKHGVTVGGIHNEAARVRIERSKERDLSLGEKKKFFEMMKRGARPHEVRVKMKLQPSQIADIMRQYAVVTVKDINRALATIDSQIEENRRAQVGVSKELPVPAQPELERQKRAEAEVNAETVKDVDTRVEGMEKIQKSQHQRRVEKILAAVNKLPEIYKDFRVPEGKEDEFLKRLSMGKRLLSRMYNVPVIVIVKEAIRIKPDINLDLINN